MNQKHSPTSEPAPWGQQLRQFGWRVLLPAVPIGWWWAMAGLLIGGLNLLLERELWPHTPGAQRWSEFLCALCGLVLLPWFSVKGLWNVAALLHGLFWKVLWKLVAIPATVLAVGTMLGGVVCCGLILFK